MDKPLENLFEPKICESCGAKFGCGAKLDGCWCAEVDVPPPVAADLKAKFKDCLCPKCLMSSDIKLESLTAE